MSDNPSGPTPPLPADVWGLIGRKLPVGDLGRLAAVSKAARSGTRSDLRQRFASWQEVEAEGNALAREIGPLCVSDESEQGLRRQIAILVRCLDVLDGALALGVSGQFWAIFVNETRNLAAAIAWGYPESPLDLASRVHETILRAVHQWQLPAALNWNLPPLMYGQG